MSADPETARQVQRSQRRHIKHRLTEVERELADLVAKHQDCIPKPVVEQVARQYVLLMGSSHIGRIPARYLIAENLILAGCEGYTWRDALSCLGEIELKHGAASCRPRNRSLMSMTSAAAVLKANIIVLVYGTNDISYYSEGLVPVELLIKQMEDVLSQIQTRRLKSGLGPAQIHVSSIMPCLYWNRGQLDAAMYLDQAARSNPTVTSVILHPWYNASCHLIRDGKHLTETAYHYFTQDLKTAIRLHHPGDW